MDTVEISLKLKKKVELVNNNSVCVTYKFLTLSKRMQNYIVNLPKPYIYSFLKFKCANHYMPIVAGRYSQTPIDKRKCILCNMEQIGDEYHYLLNCPYFCEYRIKYLKLYYHTQPSVWKMTQLFESTDPKEILNLAKFVSIIVKHFRSKWYNLPTCIILIYIFNL